MNVQKIDTNVGHLVDMVERGELRLPEMQRRYVWTATRVRDLLDSLYRGYPSGTILVWETDQEQPARDLAVRQAKTPFTAKLLLDGQQRITSLSAVIRGEPISVRNRKRPIDIAFNLDHPDGGPAELIEVDEDIPRPEEDADSETTSESDDDSDGPTLLERLRERTFAVASASLLSSKSWVLVSDIFGEKKSEWQLLKPLVESPDDPAYEKYQRRLQRLKAIRDYPYVMQVIPRTVSYEETAEIFVRVNSLGVKLRGSDLAMALVTAKWPNSLKLFESFIDDVDQRTQFTFDPGVIVRSVVVFATQQSRFNTVRSITKPQLEDAWKKAQKGIEFAVNFLRSNAGIEDESLLSSPLLMIPIAVYSQIKNGKLSSADESALVKWLFVANARGHFSGSSETVLDNDLSILFKDGKPADLIPVLEQQFGRLTVEPADIIGKGIRSALFSLSYLALKRAGAKDWYSGLGLSLTHQGRYHFIQFHHIFPKAILQAADEGYEKSEINEIANMAFITGRTNQRLSKKAPEIYFPKIIQERGEKALTDQLIPMDRNLWKVENYRDFLIERRRLLTQSINTFISASSRDGRAMPSEVTG